MNKSDKYHKVCEQFGSLQHRNPPMKVDWMSRVAWQLLFDWETLEGVCLVYLAAENRIGVAVADGDPGYTPTPCVIGEGVDGKEAVRWFNENILGVSEDEAQQIITITMRGS